MNQSEKETILAKFQELVNIRMQEAVSALSEKMLDVVLTFKDYVNSIPCKEATLFDHVEDNPILKPAQEQETITTEEKPRKTRARLKDGTMTAATIAHHLSKELGRTITKESVVRVGRQIKAKVTYCERQHCSRYNPESVTTIMNLYRSFNQL